MNIQNDFDIVKRNWGHFLQFTENENTTVKILYLKKDQSISYQYHNYRSEMWYVITGRCWATMSIDNGWISSKAIESGDIFTIPKRARHKLEGLKDSIILEISRGHFDENDIVRL